MRFHIREVDDLSVPEPPTVAASLILIDYRVPPIGWDDEKNEPIYGEITPDDVVKMEWFKAYRISLVRHTKLSFERKSMSDGTVQKAIESPWFDSRDTDADRRAKYEVLGMAVECCLLPVKKP